MTSARRKRPGGSTTAAAIITVADLQKLAPDIDEAKAEAMLEDALALARRWAPCVFKEGADPDLIAQARAIIRGAVLRWNDQGTGTLQSMSADVFGVRFDNRWPRMAGGFLREEKKDLRALCGGGGAYTIDIGPGEPELEEPPWMEFVDP